MVKSNIGSPTKEWKEENVVYLRPETCGGIYLEFKNTLDSLHKKLPFGIAQVGKAFRNEKVAHYASEAYDIEFNFRSLGGFKEVEGIHTRGNWDLSQHSKFSGVDLS